MSCSSTCKLPIVGSNFLCIVNSEWSSKCVKLLILHDNQAWSGKFQVVGDEDTADLLDQLSLTEDEYIEETKKALSTHGGADNFAYTIDCDKFTWKKYINKDMAVKFGYTTLEKVPAFSVFEEIIDKNIQENFELNTQLKRASQQNDTFTEENEDLKRKLNDLIENKCEMESSLYSQFMYLLNEKKRRINELQNQIQPNCEIKKEPDISLSDSDPFGSDTELDSEEEKQSPTKERSRNNVVTEVKNVSILPKRLRTPSKIESVAGPSGLCLKSKDNRRVSKSPSNIGEITKKPPVKGKKPLKFSCVLGDISDNKEQNNSEDDVFVFPKRSKKVTGSVELVQPSTSKIKYDDSDDEMPIDNDPKIETDSDGTPSGIDPIQTITVKNPEDINSTVPNSISDLRSEITKSEKNSHSGMDPIQTVTIKNPEDINSTVPNSISDLKSEIAKSEKISDKDGNICDKDKNSEAAQNPSFKDFSNSTLEILNQLV